MNHYDYHRPETLEEALRLAAEIPDARFIAGGTDIVVQMKKRSDLRPSALISLRRIKELRSIEVGKAVRIGACASLTAVLRQATIREWFPALIQSIVVLGSIQIRNVATVGGNLCNASPGADTAPPLLCYNARVEARSLDGVREIPIDDFFKGPGRTALAKPGEILTAVIIDQPAPGTVSNFLRKGRVQMDIAIVSVAVLLEMEGATCQRARLAAGAVAPVPLRLRKTEALLEGSVIDDALLDRVQALASQEVSPISDIRSGEEYRRDLVGVFAKRGISGMLAAAVAG